MATTRPIRPDELEGLCTLYEMLNPEESPIDRTERLESQWEAILADDTVEVGVVEHDDRLVASCLLSITPNLSRGARPFAVVENVVTHADYRGRGFGSRCLEYAVDLAAARECYKVMLLTGSDETWKHDFYETCGFDPDDKTGFVRYLD